MDDQQFKQLLEALKDALSRMGLTDGLGDLADNVDDANKNLTKQERLYKATASAFDKLNKDVEKGRKRIVDLGPALKNLNESIEELDDNVEKLALEEKHRLLANQYLTAQYKKAGKELSLAVGDVLIKGIARGTKTLVTDLQNGSSGVQIAADLLTNTLDMNQAGFTAVAKTGETLGSSLMLAGRRFTGLGAGLSVGSQALDYFSNAATDAAKFGIDVLTKEVEKTVKSFNDSTAAGAIFARGMDDMRLYARNAGLTVEQFAGVIKNSSGLLAESGYTVGDAARIIGNITSRFAVQTGKSGLTLQREMQNLGYGFQEQAEITAQVVASMKRTGAGQLSRGEIAAATADLAKDMRKVADIMGEEYKAKQDAAKKATEQYAFYEMLVKRARETNDPTLIDRVRLAFSKMSDSEQRARIQFAVSGGAVADFTANIVGAADGAGDFNNAVFNEVNPSLERLSRSSDELHDKYVRGGNETFTAISNAGIMIGAYGDTVAELNALQQLGFKSNTETSEKARGAVESLAGAQGGLQDSVMNAEKAAQDLRLALQDVLTPAIEKFGKVTNKILDGLIDKLNQAGIGPGHTVMEGIGHVLKEAAIKGLTGAGGGALIGSAVPVIGTGAGALVGGAAGVVGGTISGLYDTVTGEYAEGGVAQGPVSGYSATLHGTEAVVPLPDNRSIPVNLDSSTLTAAVNQNSSILNAILEEMKDSNSKASQIVQNTY